MSEADLIVNLLLIAIVAIQIAATWLVFAKADQPGWAAIIPIFNTYILLKVAGRPGWWLLLFLIPIVNWIIPLVVYWDVAKNFGKSDGFAIATALLPFICLPILAFSDDTYQPV